MDVNLKQVVQWLLDNGYGVVVNNQFAITSKLNSELFGIPIPVVQKEVSKAPAISLDNKKQIWNEFIQRAEVPFRVKSSEGGTYTVRQYSPSAVNKLIQIIKDPNVSYDRLVESTKHYYTTINYKILLSRYLLNDVWKDWYDNYKEEDKSQEGINRFED